MEPHHTSFELLAHFDRPKTIDMPDFEVVNDFLADEPPAILSDRFDPRLRLCTEPVELPKTPQRGVGWVLQWAAVLGVLAFATTVLTEFAYQLAAESKLAVAARAGAIEATLPRATIESVAAAVERRLTASPQLAASLHFSLSQNDSPAQQRLIQHDGDRFTVSLWASNSAALPAWLRTIAFWRGDSRIQAHAEQQMPGRKLVAVFGEGLPFGAGLPTPPKP